MERARRLPREVAEERLEKIVIMALRGGRNVVWLSQDAFTLRSLEPHKRYRARLVDGVYVVHEYMQPSPRLSCEAKRRVGTMRLRPCGCGGRIRR